MKSTLFALLVLAVFSSNSAADEVLYDSSLGTTPGGQGWIEIVLGSSNQTLSSGLLELNTLADRGNSSGYFSESPVNGAGEHPNMPLLDIEAGFTIRFDLQVVSESHNVRDDNGDGLDDRAGFSVIAISQNLQGLELAFFENRIWAYADASEGTDSLFTQAEGVDFDATAALTTYDLVFDATGYELFAAGNSILSGNLRDYNPSGATIDPYDNPSFLFVGDDTSSASSHVRIGTIQVIDAVPEPNSVAMLFMICITGMSRRNRASGNVIRSDDRLKD